MPTTTVDIANIALGRLGQLEDIAALSDATAGAKACNRYLAIARRAVLARFSWAHATRELVLTELASSTRANWDYVYDLPADFLRALNIDPGDRLARVTRDLRSPFEIGYDVNGTRTDKRTLACDVVPEAATAPRLVYVRDDDDPDKWPPHFLDAVAWRLAAEVAMPLSVDAGRARLAFDLAGSALREAAAVEMSGRQEDPPPESELISVRG